MKKAIVLFLTCALMLSALTPAMASRSSDAPDVQSGYDAPTVSTPYRYTIPTVNTDAAGTVSLSMIPTRMRMNNLSILALEETINAANSNDREKVVQGIKDTINSLADASYMMSMIGQTGSAATMNSTVETLKDQLEDLTEEEYNKSLNDVIRQLEDAIDQICIGGQSLYLTILSTQMTLNGLYDTRTATQRTISELETRYSLGQVSELTLTEAKNGLTTLNNSIESLELNIGTMKATLLYMLGEDMNGSVTLTQTPSVSDAQLNAIDYEKDLEEAKAASYTLFAADRTLEDAADTWKDAQSDYGTGSYKYKMAEHTYQAAVYTHDASYSSFESSFKSLYTAISTAGTTLSTAQSTLALKQKDCAASELKYQLGNISYNTLLTAREAVTSASRDVDSAKLALYTAYHSYRTAVEYGVVS